MKKLQCRHDRFPIFAAPPISDRSRELGCKNSSLRHTHAVGLDATATTKIFQRSIVWSYFQFCSIYTTAPLHATRAYMGLLKCAVCRTRKKTDMSGWVLNLNVIFQYVNGEIRENFLNERLSEWPSFTRFCASGNDLFFRRGNERDETEVKWG